MLVDTSKTKTDAVNVLIKMENNMKQAKENVQWLLENEAGLADMHGLVYWAERVEALRAEITAKL